MTADRATLVTLATYNEIENLPRLVGEILAVAPRADILVIDDNSPDGTGAWCDATAAGEPRLKCLHRPGKLGLGTAIIAGMQYAIDHGYRYVLNMDADFSHHPRHLPAMLAGMDPADGPAVDVMIGSRYIVGGAIEGWPWGRHLMSRTVNAYARLLLGLRAKDCSGAFRCYRTALLERVDFSAIRSRGYSFQEEILWHLKRLGARFGETPITFTDRRQGVSKINSREAFSALGIILALGARNWLRAAAPPPPSKPRAPWGCRVLQSKRSPTWARVAVGTRVVFHVWNSMTVLVTGGAGFIGSHFIERLLAASSDAEVVCLDDFNAYYDPALKRANAALVAAHRRVTVVDGSINDAALVRALFASHAVRQVVHLAGYAGVRASMAMPLEYEEANVRGTLVLLEAARRHPLERFLLVSSSTVYGAGSPVPFVEDAPLGIPLSTYGVTKRAAELLALHYHRVHNVPAACLRPFSVYGPRMRRTWPSMSLPKPSRVASRFHCSATARTSAISRTSATFARDYRRPSPPTEWPARRSISGITSRWPSTTCWPCSRRRWDAKPSSTADPLLPATCPSLAPI